MSLFVAVYILGSYFYDCVGILLMIQYIPLNIKYADSTDTVIANRVRSVSMGKTMFRADRYEVASLIEEANPGGSVAVGKSNSGLVTSATTEYIKFKKIDRIIYLYFSVSGTCECSRKYI